MRQRRRMMHKRNPATRSRGLAKAKQAKSAKQESDRLARELEERHLARQQARREEER